MGYQCQIFKILEHMEILEPAGNHLYTTMEFIGRENDSIKKYLKFIHP